MSFWWGALVPLFWISCDVSSGFQSQCGFKLLQAASQLVSSSHASEILWQISRNQKVQNPRETKHKSTPFQK